MRLCTTWTAQWWSGKIRMGVTGRIWLLTTSLQSLAQKISNSGPKSNFKHEHMKAREVTFTFEGETTTVVFAETTSTADARAEARKCFILPLSVKINVRLQKEKKHEGDQNQWPLSTQPCRRPKHPKQLYFLSGNWGNSLRGNLWIHLVGGRKISIQAKMRSLWRHR